MGTLQATAQGELAWCSFDADAAAAAFRTNLGFSAFLRNGAGDYTLTLGQAQNLATAGNVQLTIQGSAAGFGTVEVVSTTQIRVRTYSCTVGMDADTAAADLDFWIRAVQVAPQ